MHVNAHFSTANQGWFRNLISQLHTAGCGPDKHPSCHENNSINALHEMTTMIIMIYVHGSQLDLLRSRTQQKAAHCIVDWHADIQHN